MEKRYCLECKEPLHGRADQKFCSDVCRTAYHNRMHTDKNKTIRHINSILRKNRRILEELNPNGKIKVPRDKLIGRGFMFSYFTNTYTTKTGKVYFYCYDQGYLPLEGDWYVLVKKQEWMDE